MWRFFQPPTVRNTLSPFFALNWFFGGANIPAKRPWRILYTILITVFGIILHTYTLSLDVKVEKTTAHYISMGMRIAKIPEFIFLMWLWEWKGARTMENAIIELAKLDQELKNFNLEVNHKKFMFKQLLIFGVFLVILTLTSVLQEPHVTQKYDRKIINNRWTYFLLILSMHTIIFQYMIAERLYLMMLETLRIRFKLVNEIFKRIADSEERIKIKILTTSNPPEIDVSSKKLHAWRGNSRRLSHHLLMERVDRACRIHRRLLKLSRDVGDVFSLIACANFPNLFVYIVQHAWMFVSFINNVSNPETSVLVNVSSTIYVVAKFWQIVVTCSNTSDEANKLGVSLYRLPIEDVAVHNQLQEYSVHIVQLKLRFTAGGIFVIDRTYARFILSTIAKYIVVLLQFGKSDGKG